MNERILAGLPSGPNCAICTTNMDSSRVTVHVVSD